MYIQWCNFNNENTGQTTTVWRRSDEARNYSVSIQNRSKFIWIIWIVYKRIFVFAVIVRNNVSSHFNDDDSHSLRHSMQHKHTIGTPSFSDFQSWFCKWYVLCFPRRRKQSGMEKLNSTLNLFGGEKIGIFDKIEQLKSKGDPLKTWAKLEKHELRLRMSMAPRNYFEKMAYWTEEGKIWHFPIDNEQGMRNAFIIIFIFFKNQCRVIDTFCFSGWF